MIKIRLDVDYPYPSRLKSFLLTTLEFKSDKDYLKNSKIIAKMVNESSEEIMAYWFFTPYTVPDLELLQLLHPDKHEVALHVATQPYAEWKNLELATKRKVKYYTVHGTARLIARLIWKRKIWEGRAPIPPGFPLKSFYDFSTLGLDRICYTYATGKALRIANEAVAKGDVLHIHPEWLFNRGTLNHRGPYYEVLRKLLHVDEDLSGLSIAKKGFFKTAKFPEQYEYVRDLTLENNFLKKLADRGLDLFTFIERKWCCPVKNPSKKWIRVKDNVALLEISSYNEWWNLIGKKTRNMVRKAEKSGVRTEIVEPSQKLISGICKIFNETPIRQGRAFSHYGFDEGDVKATLFSSKESTFIGAFIEDELVGFVQLVQGDQIVVMSQILSLQKFWDKAVNNALIAKAVEVCASKNAQWLMYGRMGNHPSLDGFKKSNGFIKYDLTRFYLPLTQRGLIASKFGLHREIKDILPKPMKALLIPVFNWISRNRMKFKS